MTKNKKIILGVGLIVLLIAAIVTVMIVRHNMGPSETETEAFDTYEEAYEKADFSLKFSDRICGYPATQFKSNSSTIEVLYGDDTFTRKTYAVADNSTAATPDENYSETDTFEINGMNVTFKGNGGRVYLATWNFNNYAYTISISSDLAGASPEEMTAYVNSTQ